MSGAALTRLEHVRQATKSVLPGPEASVEGWIITRSGRLSTPIRVPGTGTSDAADSLHSQFGERAIALQANFVVGLYALGLTYCRTGELGKGRNAFDRLVTLSNRAAYFIGWAALARGLDGRAAEARLLGAEIADRYPSEYVHPVAHMLVAIAGGDRDGALHALETCVALQASGFQLAHAAPFLGTWAGEPAFAALLERLHVWNRGCRGG